MTISKKNGPMAVLKYIALDKGLGTYAGLVMNAFKGNASAPNPPVTPAAMKTAVDAVITMETAPKGTYTAAQIRAKRLVVRQYLRQLREYAQTLVDAQTTYPDGVALIESLQMRVRIYTKPNKPELAAKNTGVPGHVGLTAKALKRRATYYWQNSVNGTTWIDLPDTMKARTSVTGLTVVQTHYFRFRVAKDPSHVINFCQNQLTTFMTDTSSSKVAEIRMILSKLIGISESEF